MGSADDQDVPSKVKMFPLPSTATQDDELRQETPLRVVLLTGVGEDQDVPSKVSALPELSTATQNPVSVHERALIGAKPPSMADGADHESLALATLGATTPVTNVKVPVAITKATRALSGRRRVDPDKPVLAPRLRVLSRGSAISSKRRRVRPTTLLRLCLS
jgi:hypothetical protein